jgi:peptidyl-prolyl cis-trans isomerase SurA
MTAPLKAQSGTVLDRIVAIVDDQIILQSELLNFAYTFAFQLNIDPRKDPDKFEEVRRTTLQNLITQKVLYTKALLDSVVVDDRQVDSVLEEQLRRLVDQLGSEEKVEEFYGMSLRQIRRDFRDEVRERLLVEALQAQRMRQVSVSRREVEEFYSTMKDSLPKLPEQVKLRHILLQPKPSEEAEQKARARIDTILARLRSGADFAELARLYSEDPGSAKRGGEIGFAKRGDFVPEFEEAAFALKPGEISDVVRTQFGFHVIQVLERRGEKIRLRQILIRLQTSPEDEKKTAERLLDIRRRIQKGEWTFAEAAKKFSEDPNSADKGGDLGWFKVDEFQLEAFKKAVEKLQVGEISDPVKTQFGLHLILLEDRRPARELSLQEDWEQIEQWALNIKRRKEFEAWVEKIKKDVYIEIKEES